MHRRTAGLLGFLLAGALVLGACSSGSDQPSSSPTTTTGPSSGPPGTNPDAGEEAAPEETPEQRGMTQLGALLDAEGRLSKEQALALWAARISPLPGVEALPRDQVADVELELIQARVAAMVPELSPEQQAIVQPVLDGQDVTPLTFDDDPASGDGTTATTVRAASGPVLAEPASVRVGAVTDDELRLAAVEARVQFARVHGGPTTLPIDWGIASMSTPDPDNCADGAIPGSAACPWAFDDTTTGAKTQPVFNVRTGETFKCRVLLNRDVAVPADGAEARRFLISAIAHEMYHCEQHAIGGSMAAYWSMPEWIREGTAAFVGEQAARGSLYSQRGWWRRWLQEPERSLTTRSYDAIGLMWLVDTDLGATLLPRIDAVVRASVGGTAPAFRELTLPAGPNLWTRWATHLANLRGAGTDEWHPQGLYATDDRPVAQRFGLPVDAGPVTLGLPTAYAGKAVRIDLAGEVVEVRTPTAVGVGIIDTAGTRHTLAEGSTTRLCVNPGGCAPCPDGRSLRTDQDVAPGIATGYLASFGGAGVQFDALSRDRACGPDPTTTTAAPSGSGDLGDPEVVCNRVLPPDDAEAILGGEVTTEHGYGTANDYINYPTYACRWRVGAKYLWANLQTEPDGAQAYHGVDQFNVDTVYTPVRGMGSEARFVKPKPPLTGITQLDIVDNGNWLTITAEGPIANNETLLARAGQTISSNWP